MVKVKESLVGQRFGKLTVIKQDEDYINPKGKHFAKYLCQCDCGNEKLISVTADGLKSGNTKSCGCLKKTFPSITFTKKNKIDLSSEYGIMWSTNTDEEIYFDIEDAEKILRYSWGVAPNGYPVATINNKKITLHTFLGFSYHDHNNRNKLDNRKINLIPCTASNNSINQKVPSNNTSGIIGVGYHKQTNKWRARIVLNQKEISLGLFNNKEDAITARLRAEKEFCGIFAPQKHLFEKYGIDNNKPTE